MYEAVCVVVHAAPRTELRGNLPAFEAILRAFTLMTHLSSELHLLREMVMHKFGREFSLAVMENRNECVPARVRDDIIRNEEESADPRRKGHQQAHCRGSPIRTG